jgi:signal transduction histidine kinase
VLGVLDVEHHQINRFNDEDVKVLTTLAEQIAIAVQNARLYADQVRVTEELREVDRMKSQFLASMSHELRTPLNSILNFTEFVMTGMFGDVTERQKDALGKALNSGKHLLALINDILDMSKIQAGMMTLYVEKDINLYPELQQVSATAQTLLKDKSVRYIEDIDPDLPLIVGDKRRLRQVLLNLVSNAAKFTAEGSIIFRVKNRGANILFSVIDTGPGIAPEDHQLIFEPFRQTDTGMKQLGGTGLGLPISKRLIEAHDGQIWVESQVGQGAAFYVCLPLKSPVLEAQLEAANV